MRDLMQSGAGQLATRPSRQMVRQAQRLQYQVQMAGLMSDGFTALKVHQAHRAIETARYLRFLAGDDPELQMLVSQILHDANGGLDLIASGLLGEWGL